MKSARTARRAAILLLSALPVLCAPPAVAHAQSRRRPVGEGDARRAIARVAGLELKTGDVRVRDISAAEGGGARVLAEVRTVFRFRKDDAGRWRVAEFRVGDRAWEDLALLERAVGDGRLTDARAELEELAFDLEGRQREAGGGELRRGPFRLENFSALLSSATAEGGVELAFHLARDVRGRWEVARIASAGGAAQVAVGDVVRALDAEKRERARADLESVRAALEAYRAERGFYVVADEHAVLIDHLSPRYLGRVIRLDPWHRPYHYMGTRDRYALRSDGADGLPGTADDVTVSSQGI